VWIAVSGCAKTGGQSEINFLSADLAGQSPLNQAMFTRRLLFLVIAPILRSSKEAGTRDQEKQN
jgi:hypothetical protein